MRADEFETWQESAIATHAESLVRAANGNLSFDAAVERARRQLPGLLPDGLASDGTWLFVVLDGNDDEVGTLWIGPHPERENAAYIWDIRIAEAKQNQGFGKATIRAAEDIVRAEGMTEIGLNVFGFNDRARRLYEKLGYRVVTTQMTKALELTAD
jgi:ribosomal protein S18 acetylase RimI-like enzyme